MTERYKLVKVTFGGADVSTLVSSANPLPVSGPMTDSELRAEPVIVGLSSLYGVTRFGEQVYAKHISQMNFKPTWGVSMLRYVTVVTGAGASVSEVSGEFRLQSGTANSSIASIRTNQRGQYKAGAMGEVGIGIRIPTAPTGTAFCEWGYTDFTNGFYFGVDGTGKYVAYVVGGVVNKIYQSDWNVDVLDGAGVSGYTLDLSAGQVSQIEFTWYGYGDIEFLYLVYDASIKKVVKTPCHRFKIIGGLSVIDPNQPLMFRVSNGASTTTNVSLYIGGHQFSSITGENYPQVRKGGELLTSYTTALNTAWQPLIAFRKKAIFNGRDNSVKVQTASFIVSSDSDLQIRYTVGGTTSNLSWADPTGRTATETAVETKITTGTALTASVDGEPMEYTFVSASGSGASRTGEARINSELDIGAEQEIILWVRRLSAVGAVVVKMAAISWTEEW